MLLDLAIEILDGIFVEIFSVEVKSKIENNLERRNVERTIARCAEAPAQSIESYFRNENIGEAKAKLVLYEVREAIESAGVNAKMLAQSSLDSEKLTAIILSNHPIPQSMKDEGLEWQFQMALQISADSLCKVGVRFAEWERESWRRTYDSLDKLLENQEEILRLVGPGGEGSADDRFAHTYRSHLLRRLAQIDASTFRVSSSLFLDFSTVFVPPDVRVIPSELRTAPKVASKPSSIASVGEARQQVLALDDDEDQVNRVAAEKFVAGNMRCAIVGPPGSGKSTFLQSLLLSAAENNTISDVKGLTPILIRAKELNPDRLPGPEGLLEIGVGAGKVVSGIREGFVRRGLESGRIMLLIDGLDEVVTSKRETVYDWIRDFVDMFPNAKYIVSSRPAGYQSEFFTKLRFNEASLAEFTHEQIQNYVLHWTKAIEISEGASPEEAEKSSVRYATSLGASAEKNPYVRRIATNPLLLSTLCLVQKYEGGELPNRRVVLYQRCLEGLLFHWDKKRGLPTAILGSLTLERKIMLLRRLALEMQISGNAECDSKFVEQSFGKSLREVGEQISPNSILANICERSGLLVERRPGVLGFSHLTFQEYLAAASVKEGDFSEYDRFFLYSKRQDTQWAEVTALYAGVAPKDSVDSLLTELIKSGESVSIFLSGKCLAAAAEVPLKLQRHVIKALMVLPDEGESGTFKQEVGEILASVNQGVALECAIESLTNLERIHGTRYLFHKMDPSSITPLFEAAVRIITGRQNAGNWAYGLSLVILRFKRADAAEALAKIAEMTDKNDMSPQRLSPLWGFWSASMWHTSTQKLPGVLEFFLDSGATKEQLDLCKFIGAAASPSSMKAMISSNLGEIDPLSAPSDVLLEKLGYLSATQKSNLGQAASQAHVNLLRAIDEVKSLQRKRDKHTEASSG